MQVFHALYLSRRPAVAFVIVGLFWGCFAAYVPQIKERLDVSDATFGLLLLCNALGLVSSMVLAPRLDRLLGARGMQIGSIALTISFLLPGFASDALSFGLAMVIVGAASGFTDVLMNARVSELEQLHSKPLMNANHGMFSVGYAVAAILSGVAREAQIAPGPAFATFAAAILILSIFLYMPPRYAASAAGTGGRYPIKPIVLCGLIVLVAFMTEATVETWSALHIERSLQGRAAEGAMGPAMLGLTMAIGRFSGQAVSQIFSETKVIILATCVAAAGGTLAALALTPFWAAIGFGILGLGISVVGPLGLALVGKKVPDHLRTEAISRVAVLGFAGFFLAPSLMGLLSDFFGLRIAFLAAAGLSLTAIPLTLLLRRA
ncbi:MFS transporter [uncultured Planktomarina sp.]|uniref:MFS transporter n=1 Tax=uncultured Planktomarina sp. TaxID=1538529 RepID=UPI0032603578